MKKTLINILLILLPVFLSACYEDDSCSQNTDTGINVTVTNEGDDFTTVESWKFTALDDTTALVSSDNLSYTAGIPLDMNDTVVELLFSVRASDTLDYVSDTVIIHYVQTDLSLLSVNCGFAPTYNITELVHTINILDSVLIYEQEVSTDLVSDNAAFYY